MRERETEEEKEGGEVGVAAAIAGGKLRRGRRPLGTGVARGLARGGEREAAEREAVDLVDRGEKAGSVDRAVEIPRGDLVRWRRRWDKPPRN